MKRFVLFTGILLTGILLLLDCVNRRSDKDTSGMAGTGDMEQKGKVMHNMLTDDEAEEGWQLLFDGKTTAGWRDFNGQDVGEGWTLEDGCLTALGKGADIGGDIVSAAKYGNFELKLEWKIAPGGNSGILYRVLEGDYPAVYYTGPEYQLIDDIGFPEPLETWQTTGANYGMHPPVNAKIMPVGEWNSSAILVDGDHVEHWLNGVKVVEYTFWNDAWKELVAKGKWKDFPAYGMAREGHISLQDHGSRVWFRNIKIRIIP